MAPSVEKISIWVLEALEEEWRREPDWTKCRTASQVLGPLKPAHQIEDADITRALHFLSERGYIKSLKRPDGPARLPSDDGLAMLARIKLARTEETESKRWTRTQKIAVAAIVVSVILPFVGWIVFGHAASRPAKQPLVAPQTNMLGPAPP
jgi:DNA-binding PadR family transcriptional regulator